VISNFVTEIAPIVSILEVKFIDLFKLLSKKALLLDNEDDDENSNRLLFTSELNGKGSLLKGINHTPN
jgi:hypothetical protein